jgi:drug/metabolite transporter (DMT)-like permease
VYTVYLRTRPEGIPGLALIACCGTVGVMILAPMVAFEHLFLGGTLAFTPASLAAMLYVGIFPSLLGYIFWNRAVEQVGSNVAGVFVHLMPAFGSLLAWMFLGERIYAYHLAGIGLILAGIALTSRGARTVPAPGPE